MEAPETPWEDEIKRVKQGDEEAAKRLVERLYPTVIKIVRSHKHRTEDEEDIAQDIFMKVFTKIDQFKGPQPFDHWVSRVALNTCYDRLRHHKIRKVMTYSELSLEESEFLEYAMKDQPEAVPAMVTGESATELLEKLMAGLKPREQKVVRMLDLEERSVKEVCALTGWGDSKVKVTAHRARKKLAENLKRLEGSAMRAV